MEAQITKMASDDSVVLGDPLDSTIVIDDFVPFGIIPSRGFFSKLAPRDWMSKPDEVACSIVFEKVGFTGTAQFLSDLQALANKAYVMKAVAIVIGTTTSTVLAIGGQWNTRPPLPGVICTIEELNEGLYGGLGQKKALITPIPLRLGDHIRRKIEGAGGYHHGLYVGAGRVVHFTDQWSGYCTAISGLGAGILKSPIMEFMKEKAPLEVIRDENYDRMTAVQRAMSAFEDGAYPCGIVYHLSTNNCEHFARWCCTGNPNSKQVRDAAVGAGMSMVIIAAGYLLRAIVG